MRFGNKLARLVLLTLLLTTCLLAACGSPSAGETTNNEEPASGTASTPESTDATSTAESQASGANSGELKQISIAEPVHNLGYLPLYAAVEEGFFKEEGLNVEIPTLAGGAHVNSLLSKQVWGFIGGPESAAVANIRGASLYSVANVVNRGNVYFMTKKGLTYDGGDLGDFLRGKTIVGGRYGGTPNAILRYVLQQESLDPDRDVRMVELSDSGSILPTMKEGQGDIAVVAEPVVTQGIQENVWEEPFYNAPKELGPYAYSVIVVQKETIDNEPETVAAFVRALARGQELVETDRNRALEIAKKSFPTLDPALVEATLDRAYADKLWEGSFISEQALDTALEVVRAGDILQDESDPVTYEDVVDMRFVEQLQASGTK